MDDPTSKAATATSTAPVAAAAALRLARPPRSGEPNSGPAQAQGSPPRGAAAPLPAARSPRRASPSGSLVSPQRPAAPRAPPPPPQPPRAPARSSHEDRVRCGIHGAGQPDGGPGRSGHAQRHADDEAGQRRGCQREHHRARHLRPRPPDGGQGRPLREGPARASRSMVSADGGGAGQGAHSRRELQADGDGPQAVRRGR